MMPPLNKIKESIQLKITTIKSSILKLPTSHKFYLLGWLTIIVIFILNAYFNLPLAIKTVLPYSFYLIFSLGLIVEFFQNAKEIYTNHITAIRIVASVVSYFIIQISYTMAKHDIHIINGLPHNYFPNSLVWLAIANGLAIITTMVLFLFLVLYVVAFLLSVIGDLKTTGIMITRMLGGILIFLSLVYIQEYIFASIEVKKTILIQADYYKGSSCDVDKNHRVAYLDNNKLSIAYIKNSQWEFKDGECQQTSN